MDQRKRKSSATFYFSLKCMEAGGGEVERKINLEKMLI